jgi:hypothetical protein
VYKPPILHQHVNHGNDIRHTLTGNSDNEVQEPGEVPADDSSSDSSEGSTKQTVTNNNKGPITMNCSHPQFVMYKCGPPLFGPGSSPSDANDLLLCFANWWCRSLRTALDKRKTSGSYRNSMSCSTFLSCFSSFIMPRSLMPGPERGT